MAKKLVNLAVAISTALFLAAVWTNFAWSVSHKFALSAVIFAAPTFVVLIAIWCES